MKTRITEKPKKCLKFEGYIYLPDEDADKTQLRGYASRTAGCLIIYDEFGKPIKTKQTHFINLGKMLDMIEIQRRKIVLKRTKRNKNVV